MTGPLHVVLGAGQIGAKVVDRLAARGAAVRLVKRTRDVGRDDVDVLAGDVADLAFAERACAGAAVVYHCVNTPYPAWERTLEPIARGAIHGARRAGARLVVLDNLYHLAPPTGPITEDAPVAPPSRKGRVRARVRDLLLAAHAAGDVAVAIARASDFYGPGAVDSHFGDRFWRRVLAGKPAECMGDPDLPHSYALTDDVADALIVLGERAEAPGREWLVPHAPAPTTRDLAGLVGAAVGLDVRMTRMSRLLLRAAGVFSPLIRELPELTYQWEVPWIVDDARWRATFGTRATPLDEGARWTAAWVERHYAAELAARRAAATGQRIHA